MDELAAAPASVRGVREADLPDLVKLHRDFYGGHFRLSPEAVRQAPQGSYLVATAGSMVVGGVRVQPHSWPGMYRMEIFTGAADAWTVLEQAVRRRVVSEHGRQLISVVRSDRTNAVELLHGGGYQVRWRSWAAHAYFAGPVQAEAFAAVRARIPEEIRIGRHTSDQTPGAYELYTNHIDDSASTPATGRHRYDFAEFSELLATSAVRVKVFEAGRLGIR